MLIVCRHFRFGNRCLPLLLTGLLFILANPVKASETIPDEKEPLPTVIGFSLGPYALKNGRGIISDIIHEALVNSPVDPQFDYVSNKLALKFFYQGRYRAMGVVNPKIIALTKTLRGENSNGTYLSKPFITFHNKAITLSNQTFKVSTASDLSKLRVIAFSNAKLYLGEPFASAMQNNPDYHEFDEQLLQVDALFRGHVDVIVADKLIFDFYRKQLINAFPTEKLYRQKATYHSVFTPSTYSLVFHEKKMRDLFDAGFQKAQASGATEKIFNRYSRLLSEY